MWGDRFIPRLGVEPGESGRGKWVLDCGGSLGTHLWRVPIGGTLPFDPAAWNAGLEAPDGWYLAYTLGKISADPLPLDDVLGIYHQDGVGPEHLARIQWRLPELYLAESQGLCGSF